MENRLSILSNYRTYGIELIERNYPEFLGKYNAYVSVYGQLSGNYMGCIEEPLKVEVTEEEIPNLLNQVEEFLKNNRYTPVSIW